MNIIDVLENLSRKFKELSNRGVINITFADLDGVLSFSKEALDKEVLSKFFNNNINGDLTEAAKKEAEYHNLNIEKYKASLKLLLHSKFKENIHIIKHAVNQYNAAKIDIDALFASNSINTLASIYHFYKKNIPISKLILQNAKKSLNFAQEEESSQKIKTTFVHELLELPASEENKNDIVEFFKSLGKLLDKNKKLVKNYLNLSDQDGKTILGILETKSKANELYRNLDTVIKSELGLSSIAQNSGVNTHTSSIHSSVDKSLVELVISYLPENILEISADKRSVEINRDRLWDKRIHSAFNMLANEIVTIIETNDSIRDFIMPISNEEKEVAKFRFYAKTAFRLLAGIDNIVYGNSYKIITNQPVSCGLTIKEIVAIGYIALKNEGDWNNPSEKNQHFIQFIENLYIAKRGYNKDLKGDDEWENSINNNEDQNEKEDQNKCTGGTVNQIVAGLMDHKKVEVRVVDSSTMKSSLLMRLPEILKELLNDTENVALIKQWLVTEVLAENLLNKIIEYLNQDENFNKEFSLQEIKAFSPLVLNKLSIFELREKLLPHFPEFFGELVLEGSFQELAHTFVFNPEKGYILFLEDLFYKDEAKFTSILSSLIINQFYSESIYSEDAQEAALVLDLLFSSQDKVFLKKCSDIFKVCVTKETLGQTNQHLIISVENGYNALSVFLIEAGASIEARDNRAGHFNNELLILAIEKENFELVKYITDKCKFLGYTMLTMIKRFNISKGFSLACKLEDLRILKYIFDSFISEEDLNDKEFMSSIHLLFNGNFFLFHQEKTKFFDYAAEKLPALFTKTDKEGRNILYYFASNLNIVEFEYISKKFPDSLANVDNNGETVLHKAVRENEESIVKAILNQNPGLINIFNHRGRSPLHEAASGSSNLFNVLCRFKEIDLNQLDRDGNNILHLIAKEGSSHSLKKKSLEYILDLLIKKGVDVNKKNNDNKIAFELVHENKKMARLSSVFEKIKGINTESDADENDLHLSIETGDIKKIKQAINKAKDINIVDMDGETILHKIASDGTIQVEDLKEIIRLLYEKGINISHLNNRKQTAIDINYENLKQAQFEGANISFDQEMISLLENCHSLFSFKRSLESIDQGSSSSSSSKIRKIEVAGAIKTNFIQSNSLEFNIPYPLKLMKSLMILPFELTIKSSIIEDSSNKLLVVRSEDNNHESHYSSSIAYNTFFIQQGLRFLPTVKYFFNIYNIDVPNIDMSPEIRAGLDFALGLFRVGTNNDVLVSREILKTATYYASLKTTEITNKIPINDAPKDLISLAESCKVELLNGFVSGVSLLDPVSTVYGLISGAAQCLSKHHLFKQETAIESSSRFALDNIVGIATATLDTHPFLKVMAVMSNVVMADIAFKVISSGLDIGLNGIDNNIMETIT